MRGVSASFVRLCVRPVVFFFVWIFRALAGKKAAVHKCKDTVLWQMCKGFSCAFPSFPEQLPQRRSPSPQDGVENIGTFPCKHRNNHARSSVFPVEKFRTFSARPPDVEIQVAALDGCSRGQPEKYARKTDGKVEAKTSFAQCPFSGNAVKSYGKPPVPDGRRRARREFLAVFCA